MTRPADDPVLELSGDIDGLPADLSENVDRYLDETFVAEPRAPYRAPRRRSRTTVRGDSSDQRAESNAP